MSAQLAQALRRIAEFNYSGAETPSVIARQALAAHEAAPQQEPVASIDELAANVRVCFGEGAAAFNEGVDALAAEYKRCAAPQQAQAPGWQPIETAPKDGTNVLLVNRKGNIASGLWMDSLSGSGWYLRGGSMGPDTFFNGHHGPTHWMPWPAAPQQGSNT